LAEIEHIQLFTQAAGKRIIDKSGPLDNPADRDHCLQYAVAVALLKGDLQAEDYSDEVAQDPAIDALRVKMEVLEDTQFSRDYLDPDKRAIANRIEVRMGDGRVFSREQAYPLGHPRRREKALPLLLCKFGAAAADVVGLQGAYSLMGTLLDPEQLDAMSVSDFMALLVTQAAPQGG